MSAPRSRPGNASVRKGPTVGPDYPESHYDNPWNRGIDSYSGSTDSYSLDSPTSTPDAMGIKRDGDYDRHWTKGKK
jgi:hypothetical protein